MFVADLAALSAEPVQAGAGRCRAVLRAVKRMRLWLDDREALWAERLAEIEHTPIEAVETSATPAPVSAPRSTPDAAPAQLALSFEGENDDLSIAS